MLKSALAAIFLFAATSASAGDATDEALGALVDSMKAKRVSPWLAASDCPEVQLKAELGSGKAARIFLRATRQEGLTAQPMLRATVTPKAGGKPNQLSLPLYAQPNPWGTAPREAWTQLARAQLEALAQAVHVKLELAPPCTWGEVELGKMREALGI